MTQTREDTRPQYPKRNDMPGLKAMTERHQKRIAEIEAEERAS